MVVKSILASSILFKMSLIIAAESTFGFLGISAALVESLFDKASLITCTFL